MILFFKLIMGHALADFALQSDSMAKGKNRNRKPDMSVVPPGQVYTPSWMYWLTAHALIHGMCVWIITQNMALGVAETVCHWGIDFGKCESWYGMHEDQIMHLICKAAWVLFYLTHR